MQVGAKRAKKKTVHAIPTNMASMNVVMGCQGRCWEFFTILTPTLAFLIVSDTNIGWDVCTMYMFQLSFHFACQPVGGWGTCSLGERVEEVHGDCVAHPLLPVGRAHPPTVRMPELLLLRRSLGRKKKKKVENPDGSFKLASATNSASNVWQNVS